LIAAIEIRRPGPDVRPRLIAAGTRFYFAKNQAVASAMGIKRVCIPNRSTKTPEHKRVLPHRGTNDQPRRERVISNRCRPSGAAGIAMLCVWPA
jgi:hypothetical protein